MNKMIPLSIPNFQGNERKYVDDAVKAGWVSTGGSYIVKLEQLLSEYLNVKDVAACQSGTSAIHLALVEIGIGYGDAVLVPTLTFIAAVNPVRYQNATPIFMDCDDSLCIDPIKLRQFCENECTFHDGKLLYDDKHIKAIIVVHVFGNLAEMQAIMEIAETYNLKVVEDATEALGTRCESGKYAGMYAGTIGDFGAFSFNGNKIITTGGGGAITAKSTESVEHIRYLSTQAKDDTLFYIHNEIGYNYRMTNVQAALGVAQMEELDSFIQIKNDNYEIYKHLFEDFQYGKILSFRDDIKSNKWFYSLEIDVEHICVELKDIIKELEKIGIQTRAIWGLIHIQKPYCKETNYHIQKAVHYSERILNLPSSTNITEEEIKYVAATVKRIIKDNSCNE